MIKLDLILILVFLIFNKIECEKPLKDEYNLAENRMSVFDCKDIASTSQPIVEFFRFDTQNNDKKSKIDNTTDTRIKLENNAMTITNITRNDLSYHYKCENKFTGTSRKFNIHPYIQPIEKIKNTVTEGVYFEIICKPHDNEEYIPAHHLIWEWYKVTGNESFLIDKSDTSIYKNTTNNVLFIKHTKLEDSGYYKCLVHNSNGVDYQIISLKIRDKLSNMWPFIGVTIQVLITCLMILFWEKKYSKKRSSNRYEIGGTNKYIEEDYKSRTNATLA